MKLKKTVRRLDNALYLLQEAQAMLESVKTSEGARLVAAGMQYPLDEIFILMGHLEDKAG